MSLVELCAAYERFAKSFCNDRDGKGKGGGEAAREIRSAWFRKKMKLDSR